MGVIVSTIILSDTIEHHCRPCNCSYIPADDTPDCTYKYLVIAHGCDSLVSCYQCSSFPLESGTICYPHDSCPIEAECSTVRFKIWLAALDSVFGLAIVGIAGILIYNFFKKEGYEPLS